MARKEAMKAAARRREYPMEEGNNPAGFNHRPTRGGSPGGSPSSAPTVPLMWRRCRSFSPPQGGAGEKLREHREPWRDAEGMREGATAGAMRIGLISNSQTRRNRYISRRLLSIGDPLAPPTPRDIYPNGGGWGQEEWGRGRVRRSYVDERAHEDTPSSNRCRKDQF